MSLIQEALKRQREEQGQSPPPVAAQPPPAAPVPPPLPVAPPPAAPAARPVRHNALSLAGSTPRDAAAADGAEEAGASQTEALAAANEPRSRSWRTLIGVLVLILLLAAGGIWMTLYAVRQLAASKQPPAAAAVQPPPAAPAAPQPAPAAPAAPAPVAAVKPAPPVTPAEPAPKPQPAVEPVVQPSLPPAPPKPPEPKAAEPWPPLTVTALVGKGARGAAVINGKVVGVGETIEGVEVLSIGAQSVSLGYRGAQQVVKVGGATQ